MVSVSLNRHKPQAFLMSHIRNYGYLGWLPEARRKNTKPTIAGKMKRIFYNASCNCDVRFEVPRQEAVWSFFVAPLSAVSFLPSRCESQSLHNCLFEHEWEWDSECHRNSWSTKHGAFCVGRGWRRVPPPPRPGQRGGQLSGVLGRMLWETPLDQCQCFFLFTADPAHCVLPAFLWDCEIAPPPVNYFISSLGCCLGSGLLRICFNYRLWKLNLWLPGLPQKMRTWKISIKDENWLLGFRLRSRMFTKCFEECLRIQ